ncbi:MAG: helix-turn-helix domain-containing protein [Candidatus Sedimenticola sp. 6PFRAG7]
MSDTMAALNISRATLYDLIERNKLRTYKIGRRRYCTHQAIVECQKTLESDCA